MNSKRDEEKPKRNKNPKHVELAEIPEYDPTHA
jgi:hypothetical protein